ncbi:MAG TPA: AMP-binding protein, partial [Xanthomonadales bacterium]|nr:AMP-binding protein [Xanthomonadales bacterium]
MVDPLIPSREDCVVGPLLERWARERPDKNFLEFDDGSSWSFAEMLQRTRRAAAGLQQLGVERGSHVLCWMPNSAEAVLSWFAANYLGAVFVPLNTAYRGSLLRNAVDLSDAEILVAHASLLSRLEAADIACLRDVIVVGGEVPADDHLRYHPASILSDTDAAGLIEPDSPVQPWDINFIIFTSG